MGVICSMHERQKERKQITDKNLQRKGSFVKPRRIWEDNIKMVRRDIRYWGVDWI